MNMANNIVLKDLLKEDCHHSKGYLRYNTGELFLCTKLIHYIDQNEKIDAVDVTNILKCIVRQKDHYTRSNLCFSKNQNLEPAFMRMFEHTDLNSVDVQVLSTFIRLFVESTSDYKLFSSLLNLDNAIDEKALQQMIKVLHFSCDNLKTESLANFVFGQITKNKEFQTNLPVFTRSTVFCNQLAQFIDKYDGNIQQKYLVEACKGLPYTKNILLSLTGRGLEYTEETKKAVLAYCDAESIDYYLTNTRQTIVQDDVKILMKSLQYANHNMNTITYYRPRQTEINNEGYKTEIGSGYSAEKMEVLIKHGYVVTRDDIMFGIPFRCEIPNASRFNNIIFDQEILNECWEHDFYPNYPFSCITLEMIKLQEACNRRSKTDINQLIKKHKLVPDQKCMENACSCKNNKPVLDVLVGAGGKYTFSCIKKCASHMSSNNTLMLIINNFEKQYNEEKKQYENKIKELESQLKLLQTADDHIIKPAFTKEEKIIDQIIDDFDNEINNEDVEKNDDIETIVINTTNSKVPKSIKRKVNVPKKYAEYFKKDPKTKMSFCDLKKELIDMIRDKNWIDEKNKTVIILPQDLNTVLGIPSGPIRFEDIDKVTAMFY